MAGRGGSGPSRHHVHSESISYQIRGYSQRAGWAGASSGSRKLPKPMPTRRTRCCGPRFTRSRSDNAMLVNSSHEEGDEQGVWLRVRMLNSLVLNLRTTVHAIRDSLREADQILSARRRIIGSVSSNAMSCSKVSSADMDCTGRSGTTLLLSSPRASS
jgi:hypothetical protein